MTARVLRVVWRDGGVGGVVTDIESGEDVSDLIPLREGPKLRESQATGLPVEIDVYLHREGHAFLLGPETVATRRVVVIVR